MKSAPFLSASLLALAMASAPAHALTPSGLDCAAYGTSVAMGALSCSGAWVGNDSNQQTETLAQLQQDFSGIVGSIDWTYAGKTETGNSAGPFSSVPGGSSGTLTLDAPLTGYFVVGLKAGNRFSLYLFDGGSTGIDSLQYTTSGTSFQNDVPQGLSHASLYIPHGLPPVPEADTYLMMLAGLGLVGYIARRK